MIDQLINDLLKREGGYSNHPSDHGGPTNFGITEHVARAYGYKGDMRSLPITTAHSIYEQQYWIDPGFSTIAKTMPKLAEELFDTGVNMGPGTASKFVQRALNVLNRGTTDYPDLIVDGDIGKMTYYALDHLASKRGAKNAETVLLRAIDALQATRYIELAEKNKSQEDFMYGWLANRVGIADA